MTCFLADTAREKWLDGLRDDYAVYVPLVEGSRIVYRPRSGTGEDGAGQEACLTRRPHESARHIFLPRSEALFAYRKENGADAQVEIFEPRPPRPFLVFGARECDVAGLEVIDRVFLKGRAVDPLYAGRRGAAVIALLECVPGNGPDNACFCHWFSRDGEPAADLRLTPVAGGLLVRAASEKGKSLLDAHPLPEAEETQIREGEEARKAARAFLEERAPSPDLDQAAKAIPRQFDNEALWQEIAQACLSCRACTHLCPACYCFNITDETRATTGARIRSWDACMSSGYTLEASGHNPRGAKAARMRNRLAHKFAYYPELHAGERSCVGCGRCVRSCPAGLDIRASLRRILAAGSGPGK